MFVWWSAPFGIDEESWEQAFLMPITILLFGIALVATIAAIFWYRHKAHQRKIYSVAHVFAPYTPMHVTWQLALIAACFGLAAATVASSQLEMAPEAVKWLDVLFIGSVIGVIVGVLTWGFSWLSIVFIRSLTPVQFRYLPAPSILYKKGRAQ